MTDKHVTMDEMTARTARFEQLSASKQAFVDTRIPEHERVIFNVIGAGVTEDPDLAPAIASAEGFNVTYVGADPGKGAALHSHPTVEVFIPMSGRWAVYWGDDGEQQIELGPWDVVSVPVGVLRGFRNIGDSHAHLMAIIGGTDSGKVGWAQSVLDRARETGLELDEAGALVER
ncbi:MAG: cupin domain-containing protein [Pseudomonadota bacterium]|nr:cupin domain-containing protein [Pseudomonadota bacterium]